MKNKELDKILAMGTSSTISINPAYKTEIMRRQIDSVIIDVKRHLTMGKSVHIILVKE